MIESIAMMNADIIPVYSSKDADILNYRRGLVHFYETEDYGPYADYFLNRQIERINGIVSEELQYREGGYSIGR